MAIKEKDILEEIKDSDGVISTIADRLKCSWNTARDNIEKHESCKAALSEESERFIDFAERAAKINMAAGDSSMIKYVLSTKGRKRGWGEKQEIDLKAGIEVIKITGDDDAI